MTTQSTATAPSVGADQQVGDILLMYGEGPLSDLIVWASDGAYSHAALVADDGDLIEASLSGVRRYPLQQRLQDQANYHYIDAFRRQDGAAPALTAADAAAVLAEAVHLLGVPYPVDQLALFGAIMAVRGKWPDDPLARLLVRVAFDHLVPQSSPGGMVCSEVVYRAFSQCAATPDGRLAPAIVVGPRGTAPFPKIDWKALFEELWPSLHAEGRSLLQSSVVRLNTLGSLHTDDTSASIAPPETPDADLEARRQQVLAQLAPAPAPAAAASAGTLASDGPVDPHPNPRLVSPEDLARSPSVVPLGRLMQRQGD